MDHICKRIRTTLQSAAVAVALGAYGLLAGGNAHADIPEGFDIIATWGDQQWKLSNNPGDVQWIPDGKGGGVAVGSSQTEGWSAIWDGTAFGLGNSQSVFGNFAFTNTTGSTQEFTVTIISPLLQQYFNTEIKGSIGGSLVDTGGGGATVSAPVGGSIYTALVDGVGVRTLMDDPFSFSVPDNEAASIPDESFPFEPGPAQALTTIGIQHNFVLTAGDSVTFSSAFTIVPAPSALALLGLGALIGRRRRRA